MKAVHLFLAASVAIGLGIVINATQGPAPAAGARGQGGGRGGGTAANAAAIASATPNAGNGALIGGSLLPDKPDARGWGWQTFSIRQLSEGHA
jgi:hypothetical protein